MKKYPNSISTPTSRALAGIDNKPDPAHGPGTSLSDLLDYLLGKHQVEKTNAAIRAAYENPQSLTFVPPKGPREKAWTEEPNPKPRHAPKEPK